LGFQRHEIKVRHLTLPSGVGCEWDTLGEVPKAPGLYAFTVDDGMHLNVVYVGMTTHLWMVTRGKLPDGGGARGPQRYGRHKCAGPTRKRVNEAIGEQLRLGRTICHWLRPRWDARRIPRCSNSSC